MSPFKLGQVKIEVKLNLGGCKSWEKDTME